MPSGKTGVTCLPVFGSSGMVEPADHHVDRGRWLLPEADDQALPDDRRVSRVGELLHVGDVEDLVERPVHGDVAGDIRAVDRDQRERQCEQGLRDAQIGSSVAERPSRRRRARHRSRVRPGHRFHTASTLANAPPTLGRLPRLQRVLDLFAKEADGKIASMAMTRKRTLNVSGSMQAGPGR